MLKVSAPPHLMIYKALEFESVVLMSTSGQASLRQWHSGCSFRNHGNVEEKKNPKRKELKL